MAHNDIDESQLQSYLEAHIPGFLGPIKLEKFSGGQSNPTFKLTAASGVYVLRRQPAGKLLKSAHAVDREYRVMHALQHSAVPVPEVLHLCEDAQVIGSSFYLMNFLDGKVYWDPVLPELKSNTERAALYDAMNRNLVALHQVDIHAVGLDDYGKQGDYYARQFATWTKQYRASEIEPIDAMEQLMQWLEANLPEDDGRVALVHGDYRLDNLMFEPHTQKLIAVLDWELSTVGHPYADLAYQCMQLRMGRGEGGIDGLAGIDRTSLGIPTEAEYVARYCDRMGIDTIDHWAFYLSFSFFRLAAICQGVAKRAQQGNASNTKAAQAGAWVGPLATMALHIIETEG